MHDLIVIGAGSSGSAIAARASENPNLQVLLVEAGPDYERLDDTPADLINSHNNSYKAHDWGLTYSPTHHRNSPFPRGRVVGGSSAVNTCIALRGLPEDYNEWAAMGNDQWHWDHVLPAFNRLERDLDYGHADYHGDAGPITIRRYPHEELLAQHQAFLAAADILGYPRCDDANNPMGSGAGPLPMNKQGRLRVSSAVSYIAPARLRSNLSIKADMHMRRLIIKKRRCVGVEVQNADGSIEQLHAKTVVLSAGAIMSPAILMRSGLGPAQHLNALGIDIVEDVAGVGQNLCDHPALSVVANVKNRSLIDTDAPIIQSILRYTCEGSDKRNDLQIEQLSFAGGPKDPPRFAIAGVVEYQYGRGEVRLVSADPRVSPIIENRFCEDDRDASRLVTCLQDILKLTKTGPLKDMIEAVVFPDPIRGHDAASLDSLVRKFSASGYHPCGTVKMGPREDPGAVVDQYGRCHYLDNLVIADAAIMPFVPRANTNLTCIMIGERVGEWLRQSPATYGI
jgi:choline dehydrogenase